MIPPENLFSSIPVSAGVYALVAVALGTAAVLFYRSVLRLHLLGKPGRTDKRLERIIGTIRPVLGQGKVLQSVSLNDRAGILTSSSSGDFYPSS